MSLIALGCFFVFGAQDTLAVIPPEIGDPIPMPAGRAAAFEALGIEPSLLFRSRASEPSTTEAQAILTRRHFFQAAFLRQNNRLSEALEQLNSAERLDPSNYNVQLAKADVLLNLGKNEDSLRLLNKILTVRPDDTRTLLLKAQALLNQSETGPRNRRVEAIKGAQTVLQTARKATPRNEDVLRTLIGVFARQSDLTGLESAYRDLIEAAPRDPAPKLMMARILSETNRPDESLQFYDKVINQRRTFIPARLEKARLLEAMGRLEEAVQTYQDAILVSPRERQATEALDRLLRLMHRGDDAREKILAAYSDFSARFPYSAEIRRLYAERLLAFGDKEAAVREFRRIVQGDEENPDAHLNLGRLLLSLNRQQEALTELRRAHDLSPTNGDIIHLLGNTLLAMGMDEEAMQLFSRAVRDQPNAPRVLLGLASLLAERDKETEVLDLLEKALPEIEKDADQLAQAGEIFLRIRNFPRAARLFATAAGMKPADWPLLQRAIRAHIRVNQPDLAAALIDRARAAQIQRSPEQLFLFLGEEFQAWGFTREAEIWYRRALKESPDSLNALSRLVSLLSINRKTDEALKVLRSPEVTQLLGDESLRLQSAVFMDARKFPESIKALQTYAERRPGSLEPLLLLAESQAQAGQAKEAIETLQNAKNKFGESDNLTFGRGLVLFRLKQYAEAIKTFSSIIENRSERASEAYFFLAISLYDSGEKDKAEQTYRTGLAEFPNNPNLMNGLAYKLADANRNLDEARQLVERALIFEPRSGHFIDTLAWVHFRQGRHELAYDLIREALFLMGDDAELLEHKGQILEALNRREDAIEAYQRSLATGDKRPFVVQRLEELKPGRSTSPARSSSSGRSRNASQ